METSIARQNNQGVTLTPGRQAVTFVDTRLRGSAAHTMVETSTFMVRARTRDSQRGWGSRLADEWRRLIDDLIVSHSAPLPVALTFSHAAARTLWWTVTEPAVTVTTDQRVGMSCRTTPSALLSRNT